VLDLESAVIRLEIALEQYFNIVLGDTLELNTHNSLEQRIIAVAEQLESTF